MRAGGLGRGSAGDELIEGLLAVVTDVFVNGHKRRLRVGQKRHRQQIIIAGEMNK